mmetsp:Transcript_4153/g.12892  ORF Transcript_4153/g.12892 Transcript_4153/m.12892 type:complete len:178 (+) Transcript_4153:166-699(+)
MSVQVLPPPALSEGWEVLSQASTAFTLVDDTDVSVVDDDDDAASTCSVSTRHGFPALCPDEGVLVAAAPARATFKEALLVGAGGLDSPASRLLALPARRFHAPVKRRARKPRAAPEDDDDDPLEFEYYGRKNKGFKRYARDGSVLKARLAVLAEDDEEDDSHFFSVVDDDDDTVQTA